MHQTAKQIMQQGEEWIAKNPEAWRHMKNKVRRDVALRGACADLRIAYYVETIRANDMVHIPNAIQAYLSRRLEKEVRGARFTKSKSKLNLLMAGDSDEA